MDIITTESINALVKDMREKATPPTIIKTKEEAEEMTRNDPAGYKWVVGEGYYRFSAFIKSPALIEG